MMESEISVVISLIGQRRFGALFDLALDFRAQIKNTISSPEPMSLEEKITTLEQHGCFAIFRSKSFESIRAFPVHNSSGDCDLKAVYQTIALDTLAGTPILIFQSDSSGLENLEMAPGVAGVAMGNDVEISIYSELETTKLVKSALVDMTSYSGGMLFEVNNIDDILEVVEKKLQKDRGIVYRNAPEKGSTLSSFLLEETGSDPILELSCNRQLHSVTLQGITDESIDIDLLHSIDSLLFKSGELSVYRLDAEIDLSTGWFDLIVDCEGKYEISVSVTSDLNAYKVNVNSKLPRTALGRLALSSNKIIDEVSYKADDGDQIKLLQFPSAPQDSV